MTPKFKQEATKQIEAWRETGFTVVEATRKLEILCGQSREEFHPDGATLVETVYSVVLNQQKSGEGLVSEPAAVPIEVPEPEAPQYDHWTPVLKKTKKRG